MCEDSIKRYLHALSYRYNIISMKSFQIVRKMTA